MSLAWGSKFLEYSATADIVNTPPAVVRSPRWADEACKVHCFAHSQASLRPQGDFHRAARSNLKRSAKYQKDSGALRRLARQSTSSRRGHHHPLCEGPSWPLRAWAVIKKVVKHFVSLGVGWDCCPGEDEYNRHGYKRREHAKWLIFLPSVIHFAVTRRAGPAFSVRVPWVPHPRELARWLPSPDGGPETEPLGRRRQP
jgi:hypothetical protein